MILKQRELNQNKTGNARATNVADVRHPCCVSTTVRSLVY